MMSETKNTAAQQQPATLAATNTRKVYEKLIGSARFQNCIEEIVCTMGKHDALEAVNDITTYLGQAQLLTDIQPLTSDHFWLMQLFYELVRSLPNGNVLMEAQVKDMDECKPAKPVSHGNE